MKSPPDSAAATATNMRTRLPSIDASGISRSLVSSFASKGEASELLQSTAPCLAAAGPEGRLQARGVSEEGWKFLGLLRHAAHASHHRPRQSSLACRRASVSVSQPRGFLCLFEHGCGSMWFLRFHMARLGFQLFWGTSASQRFKADLGYASCLLLVGSTRATP